MREALREKRRDGTEEAERRVKEREGRSDGEGAETKELTVGWNKARRSRECLINKLDLQVHLKACDVAISERKTYQNGCIEIK